MIAELRLNYVEKWLVINELTHYYKNLRVLEKSLKKRFPDHKQFKEFENNWIWFDETSDDFFELSNEQNDTGPSELNSIE